MEVVLLAEINVALEVFGVVLSLILLGSLLLNGDRSSRSVRMFLWMLFLNLLCLGADAAAWYANGTDCRSLNWGGNLLQYLCAYGLLLLYSIYLLDDLPGQRRWRFCRRGVEGLCLLGIVLTLFSQFSNLFYEITTGNLYVRGEWFWLSHAVGLLVLAVDGWVVFHARAVSGRERVLQLLYVIVPALALVLDLLWEEITVLGLGSTVTLLLVFANVQLQRDRRLKEQDKELAEKRIAIMISQIQPHFLYNILGSIEWLCETNPKKAQEATDELARFLRGNMGSLNSTSTIPARRELEHIRSYLNLEKIRFGEKLKVRYEIENSDFFLPALSLQPLVENAVRHGVTKREEGGTIVVGMRETWHEYVVTIQDDGVGFDPRERKQDGRDHVGIDNVRSRLEAQCGGILRIMSEKGKGTLAEVRIPKGGRSKGEEDSRADLSSRR